MKYVKTPALLIASCLIGLLICELIVRIFSPQQLIDFHPDIWRPDDQFGFRHKENLSLVLNNGEGPHYYVTDFQGYRINRDSQEIHLADPDISILAIGDSFLEAVSVDNEDTIPQLIARELERKCGVSVRAYNAGTSMWDVNHYYREAKRSLALHTFHLCIVFIFTGNDIIAEVDTLARIESSLEESTGNRWKDMLLWIQFKVIEQVRMLLEANSHLFVFLKSQAYEHSSKIGIITRRIPSEFFISERFSNRWATTADVCSMIASECEKHRTPVMFVLLPPNYQVDEKVFFSYIDFHENPRDSVDLEQPGKLLAAEFQKRNLILVDPTRHLKKKFDAGIRLHGRVDRHFNENGHRAVAEYIFPYIEEILSGELN